MDQLRFVTLVLVFLVLNAANTENFLDHALDLSLLDVLGVKEVAVRVKQSLSHCVYILGQVLLHMDLVEQRLLIGLTHQEI